MFRGPGSGHAPRMTRPHLRRRTRSRRGAPAGLPVGSLLPLAILAGGYAYDEDDVEDVAMPEVAQVA